MSEYKSILVPVGDGALAGPALDAAFAVAAPFAAHVSGLHVRLDPALAVPLVGEGMSGAMVDELMAEAERQSRMGAQTARQAFDEACARHGAVAAMAPTGTSVTVEWIEVVGREEDVAVRASRLSDLTVVGRGEGESEATPSMTLNAVLMESGRPILVVPQALPGPFGDNIAIAWNASAEAARAVTFAMPMLKRAKTVTVIQVAEDDHTSALPGHELSTYLAWHGIEAASHTSSAYASHAADALVNECGDLGIDLLVMGAYTHSRLRQLIFGGVTRRMLQAAPFPCLMSH